jgi:predicted dehydrogenase
MSKTDSVGIGFIAATHPHVYTRADILSQMPGVRLVSVWDDEDDANARTFAERYHVERAGSLDSLLARRDIDAVIIESWTQNMAPLAVAALSAGKSVLLEKPGGNNVAAIRTVADAVARNNGYLTLGYMVRQARSQAKLKQILASGVLGRVSVARFHVSVPAPDATTPWFNLATDIGGVLFEDGCHMVDLIIDLFGKPKAVTASVPKFDDYARAHKHLYEDAAACTLTWDSLVGTLSLVGWEANDWLETWEIAVFGERGTVYAGPLPDRCHLFLKEAAGGFDKGWTRWDETQFNVSWLDHKAQHVWHAVQHRDFYRAELERFVSDVRTGGRPLIPAAHGLQVTETIAAFYEAAKHGRSVSL